MTNVYVGIQILSIFYPIYQFFIFLILMISMSTSNNRIWKFIIFIFFSIISTSFGFGGIGVVFICIFNI
jgi:hypothetical protein